ncbi:MAG: flagellar type III secretion system pore protein FliP [Polyangiales bacterium]
MERRATMTARRGASVRAAAQCVSVWLWPLLVLLWPVCAEAQSLPTVSVSLQEASGPQQMVPALKVLLFLTVLAVAPAVLISVTSFTRIVIVLSFVRQALGTQNVPPTQVVLALALLLTAAVMSPVATRFNTRVLQPYTEEKIDESEMWKRSTHILTRFLMRQTRESDLRMFYEATHSKRPKNRDEVRLSLLIPAFMISELRTGFEMGFLIFLPFVLIDLVVASILTAMGMVMLPPTMLSTPMKILLFVVVDGWSLITRSLMSSF